MSRSRIRALLGALAAACLIASPGATPAQATGDSGLYVSGGTAVARANGQPVADEGSVVCDGGNDVGVGGVCLAFGGGDAVSVVDDAAGENVPFQVCIDNDGDGVCTSPDFSSPCGDEVFFSHDDNGAFHNPVGPLPTGFKTGCDGGPWKGYIVMLCEGAHVVGADAHSHAASSGSATVTSGGEGLGTFCGGWGAQPSRKTYKVGSGARYVSGGTAAARNNGQTVVDEGAMSCNDGNNVGVGGFCVSFGGGDAVAVFDDVSDMDVAFQVCLDNNADGVCTSPDNSPTCPDQVFFSHDDAGNFFNPIGPLPTGFSSGCGQNAPWDGYVVFLCEGSHLAGATAHAHPATTGNGRVTTGGEGLGTFCGGSSYDTASRKRYAPPPSVPGTGLCRLGAISDPTAEQGVVTGTLAVGPVTAASEGGGASTTTTPPTVDTISVTCSVHVNGEARPGAAVTASGTGAASGSGQVTFVANDADLVELCADVTVSGGGSSRSRHECGEVTTVEADGDGPGDTVGAVEAQARDTAMPVGCPLLAALAPGVPGIVDINGQGDVLLNGQPVVDCPPSAGQPLLEISASNVTVYVGQV